tara:strand:+ start:109 stop:246 length:138 start_codon:yes stop_codon:yes gene_type:complete
MELGIGLAIIVIKSRGERTKEQPARKGGTAAEVDDLRKIDKRINR